MELLQALSDWPVAAALRSSAIAYPLVNAAHILSLGLLAGAVVTLDLRLLGLFGASPLGALARPLQRVAEAGLAGAAVTGFLLFCTRPLTYAENPALLVKLGLVALGIVHALLIRRSLAWQHAIEGAPVAGRLRLSALASIGIWAGAVVAGRWIGFLQ